MLISRPVPPRSLKGMHPVTRFRAAGSFADPGQAAEQTEVLDYLRYLHDARKDAFYNFAKWIGATIGESPDAAKFCRENKISIAKAQDEVPGAAGGFLVPDVVADTILTLREAYGVIRRYAQNWPLRFGGYAQVPRRLTGATAVWIPENGPITESSNTYDNASLGIRKLGCIIRASTELEEDALAGWGMFLAEEMAWAFAQAEDLAGFNGDGTSTYGGIVGISTALAGKAGKITAAGGHNTYATIDSTDIGALIGALPARALPNAALYMSIAAYGNTIVRLASTGGGLAATIGPDGDLQANYLGLPIVFCPALPTTTTTLSGKLMIAAGDMRQGIAFGERRQITVKRLAERYADIDQVAFMATERVDINVHDTGDANTGGALVGLFGA